MVALTLNSRLWHSPLSKVRTRDVSWSCSGLWTRPLSFKANSPFSSRPISFPNLKNSLIFVKYTYLRRMANEKLKRKEVSLPGEVLKKLQMLAKKDLRPLKQYMEKVLTDHAKEKNEAVQ